MPAPQCLGRLLDEPAAPPGIDSFQARGAVPPAAAKRHELVGRLPDHPFLDDLDTRRFEARGQGCGAECVSVGDRLPRCILVDGARRWRNGPGPHATSSTAIPALASTSSIPRCRPRASPLAMIWSSRRSYAAACRLKMAGKSSLDFSARTPFDPPATPPP